MLCECGYVLIREPGNLTCNFIRILSEYVFSPCFKIVSFKLHLDSKTEMEATACLSQKEINAPKT